MEHGTAAATMYDPAARGHSPDDAVSCSAPNAMSKANAPAARTVGTTTDAPTTNKVLPGVFGVDARGAVHRYNRTTNHLVVTDGDREVVHEREMAVDELRQNWIPHVGSERGWVDHWLDADTDVIDATGRLGRALKAADVEVDA